MSFRTLLSLIILALFSTSVRAQQDDLDPSFNGNGILTWNNSSTHDERANAVAVQTDGSIVVAGQDFDRVNWVGTLFAFRSLADGTPDTTFGADGTGYASLDLGALGVWDGSFYAIDFDDQGKVLLAGFTNAGDDAKFTVVRLTFQGELDSTFSEDGVVWMEAGADSTSFRIANSIQCMPDGKVVVGGYDNEHLLMAKLNTDGSPDDTFTPGGILEVGVPGATFSDAATYITPSGELFGADFLGLIAKLDVNGVLDPNWGLGGVSTVLQGAVVYAEALAQRSTGELVVACLRQSFSGGSADQALAAQLLPDGSFDPDFGLGGLTPAAACEAIWVNDVVVTPEGRAVIGLQGQVSAAESWNFILASYMEDGSVDTLFGTNGVLQTDIDTTANPPFGSSDAMWGLAVQPDGKLVGTGPSGDTSGQEDVAITRYLPESVMAIHAVRVPFTEALLFPNPTADHFEIRGNVPGRTLPDCHIMDLAGRMVAVLHPEHTADGWRFYLPVGVVDGSYVLTIRDADGVMSLPLVVAR